MAATRVLACVTRRNTLGNNSVIVCIGGLIGALSRMRVTRVRLLSSCVTPLLELPALTILTESR